VTITEPPAIQGEGLYDDIPEDAYHANHALSASGAKKLLPPSCPARYKWERDHGQPPKAAFDLGRAAHAAVLGVGAPVTIIEADNWLTKAAKAERDAAYADGRTPILAKDAALLDDMVAALRAHPIAAALLEPGTGAPEQSAFWEDPRHGIWRRARFDWLPASDGGRMILPDYKTTASAEPGAFTRSTFNFGYPLQAAFYMDAVRALGLAEDVAFVFIAQEIAPPHLVTVFELDGDSLRIGREQTDRACAVFAECLATDEWPGYSTDVELISPPAWAARQYGAVL